MDAPRELLPRVDRPRAPRRGLEQRPQRAAQRRRRPGRRARARRAPACRSRTPRTAARRTMAWVYGWVLPLQPDPAAALAQLHAAARAKLDAAAPALRGAAGGVPGRHRAPRPTPAVLAAWLDGDRLPEGVPLDLDLRWRVLVAAGHPRRGRPRRARPPARGRAHRRGPGAPRGRARLAARRRGEGLGLGAASPARPTCPTTSSRRSAWASGAAGRRSSPRRTSSATSPTCPTPSRCAAAGCWPTRPSTSSRGPR